MEGINMKYAFYLISVLGLCFQFNVIAQTGIRGSKLISTKVVLPAKPAAVTGKLDFEAEVIEGEKTRPDVFVQLGTGAQNMNSILYSREHFNDFHAVDRNFRPGFIELEPVDKQEK
jgi:hypothetical protein